MSAASFVTRNDTFKKLMGNGVSYVVPRFQRDYSWNTEQWEDLWADLVATVPPGPEPAHYMGYLVLRPLGPSHFEVIDGQQRLTTLSLVVLAVLKNLQRLAARAGAEEREQVEQRLATLRQTYVGALDPVSLRVEPKLTLNRHNQEYFAHHLTELGELPKRNVGASNLLLRRAFEWFDARVAALSEEGAGGQHLARFVEEMATRVFFTVIEVSDELNAYRVFETLNARGVKLSPTDLLKNALFATLSAESKGQRELDDLEARWEELVGRLGDEDFSDFVRVHWNSRHQFVRVNELFKRVRSSVASRERVFAFVRDLEADVDPYLELVEPTEAASEVARHARTLRLFNVRQPLALLLAAGRQLARDEFVGLVRACVVISLRYNVIGGLSPSEQESTYARAALGLAEGSVRGLAEVLECLRPVYPSDANFRAAFSERSLTTGKGRNSRLAKYVLCELESRLSNVVLDPNDDSFNVEHVLPRAFGEGWASFGGPSGEAYVHRIGNLTLLSAKENRTVGAASYEAKRAVYERSEFSLTKQLAERYAEWSPERVAARQAELAKLAAGHWSIPQLAR